MNLRKNPVSAFILSLILLSLSFASTLNVEPTYAEEEREWHDYGPCVDEWMLPLYTDYDAELLAFKAGEIHYAYIQPTRIEEVADDPNIKLLQYPTFSLQALFINMLQYPWNYTAVRKAMAHVIDKQAIVNEFYNGFGVPIDAPVPPLFGEFSNPDVATYPYSLELAKQELLDAGFTYDQEVGKWYDPSGAELGPIVIQTCTQSEAPWLYNEAFFIKEKAEEIDLPVEVEVMEFEALLVEVYAKTFKSFILYLGWSRIPTLIYELFRTGGGWNFWGLSDPRIDELCEEFYSTTNLTEAQQAAREIQAIVAEEFVPYIPIYQGIASIGIRSDVEGWILYEPFGGTSWATALNVHFTGKPLGGTFKYPWTTDPATLNPFVAIGAYSWDVLDRVLEPLFSADPDEISDDYPRLARSWTIESIEEGGENHTKITFNLVTDAYWHDGEKFDAYDVNCTWWFIKKHKPPQGYGPAFEEFLRTEIPDDYTIAVYLNGTSWTYIYDLNVPIVPEHIWGDEDFLNEHGGWDSFDPCKVDHPTVEGLTCLIGTGPFVYAERVLGEYARLVWNPNYWNRHPDKTLSIDVTAATSIYEGDELSVDISVKDYLGVAIENATLTVAILKDGEIVTSTMATGGVGGAYTATLDTSGLTGDYILSVSASSKVGPLTFSRTVTQSLSIRPQLEKYLPYIGAAVAIVIIIVIILMLRRRGKE